MSTHPKRARKPKVYKPAFKRYRFLDNLTRSVELTEYQNPISCTNRTRAPDGYAVSFTSGDYTTMEDVVVPGWRERSKNGELFFNPMHRVRKSWELLGGTGWQVTSISNYCTSPNQQVVYDAVGKGIVSCLTQIPHPSGKSVVNDDLRIDFAALSDQRVEVATRLLNERGRADSNLFETLAELDQTVGLFERPMSRMRRLLREASNAKRKGKFLGYAANGMSNLYLAYRYGIKPIMSDIEAISEGLKKQTGKQRKTTRAKSNDNRSFTRDFVITVGLFAITLRQYTEYGTTVRGMSLDDVDLSVFENIGFTAKGLITLPWELTPYSFVGDWFVNFGDYLGAITPAVGWNQVGTTMTQIISQLTTYEIIKVTNNLSSTYTVQQYPTGGLRIHHLERSRFQPPSPGLVVKNDFRFDKLTRVADAMALMGQQIHRIFR